MSLLDQIIVEVVLSGKVLCTSPRQSVSHNINESIVDSTLPPGRSLLPLVLQDITPTVRSLYSKRTTQCTDMTRECNQLLQLLTAKGHISAITN